MTGWFWIVILLLVIAGGASWQMTSMARRMRTPTRTSLRARRAEMWRRRQEGGPSKPDETPETRDDD